MVLGRWLMRSVRIILMSALGLLPFHAAAGDAALKEIKKLYIRPPTIPYPEQNPFTKAKETLGKLLFFDPRLSDSGSQSCGTCHNPSFGWEDGMALAIGHGQKKLARTSPSLLNLAWDDLYFWDGRADSLEAQALGPIESEKEMGMTGERLVSFLRGTPEYVAAFTSAFPAGRDPITLDNVARALATFERGIVSAPAPFDAWIAGDERAIPETAKRGFLLFNGKAKCAACHSGWRFSDGSFHDIGLDDPDVGRGKFLPRIAAMQNAFKTVGLRNIARRAPYMHNGSLATLGDVVNFYNDRFVIRKSLSDEIKPLNLTSEEKADLLAFLNTLTGDDPPIIIPILPR